MPTYSYRCEVCGLFEKRVAMSKRKEVSCECGRAAQFVFRPRSVQIAIPRRFRDGGEAGIGIEDVY